MHARSERFRAICALALIALAGGAGGCALFGPLAGPLAQTQSGRVEMDWPSHRRLRIVEHRHRRDRRGHLVVLLVLRNHAEDLYEADLRVAFADQDGIQEEDAHRTIRQEFPPGDTRLEWTSATPEAASYRVEVRGTGLLPW